MHDDILVSIIDFNHCPKCGSNSLIGTFTLGDIPQEIIRCMTCKKTYYFWSSLREI